MRTSAKIPATPLSPVLYITNGFLDSEDELLSLSLKEYAENEEERMRKMPIK